MSSENICTSFARQCNFSRR